MTKTDKNKDELSRNRKTALDAQKDPKIDKNKRPVENGKQTSDGEDPTRYGDWTKNGRAIDF